MADGCTKFGREGAGTFQCPRPLCIGRNLTYPVPWHLSMPWVGPWLRRCRPTFCCMPSERAVGPSRARPAALKGATGRIGKIPTYVKRSRALKSARSFSPKFRAGRRRVSPTPSPTSTNPANVCLTRPGAPAPPLEPFLGVRISEHPKSRTCIEKPVINLCECAALQPLGRRPPSSGVDNRSDVEIFPIARRYRVSCTPVCVTKVE